MLKYRVFLLAFLGVMLVSVDLFGQNALTARHEDDAQTQIVVNCDGPVAGSGTAGWTIDIGGNIVTPSSVTTFGNDVFINLTPTTFPPISPAPTAILPGEAVTVTYSGGGVSVTPFVLVSQNNKAIDCNAFEFQALIGVTPPCAPVNPQNKMVFSILPGARNSSNFDFSDLTVLTNWQNPAALPRSTLITFESNDAGLAASDAFYLTVDASLDGFTYPPNEIVCSYESRWRVQISGVGVCTVSSPNQFVTYASHNTDAAGEGDGALSMLPTVPNTDQVCLNDNVNMTYSDLSDLNCVDDPEQPNIDTRWVRIRYGDLVNDGNRIADIRVGGVQVTDASGNLLFPGGFVPTPANPATGALGAPDNYGTVQFNNPDTQLPAGILEPITTGSPINRVIGQRFTVILEYWNVCNPYVFADGNNNARRITDQYIEIIDIPVPPTVTPNPAIICSNRPNGEYTLTATSGVGGTPTYRWYDDPGLTNLVRTGATFNPITQDGQSKNPGAPYTQNYYVTVTSSATVSCTSEPTQVPFTIHIQMNGGTIGHPLGASPAAICTGDDPAAFTNIASATGGDGVTYNYQWQSSITGPTSGFNNIGGETGFTHDPGILTQTTWFRRRVRSDEYNIAGTCDQAFSNVYEIRVDQPVIGGSIGNAQTICTGDNPTSITNTGSPSGGSGSFVYQWESSTTGPGGPFSAIGGANSLTYNPPVLTNTTWYRRNTISGVCIPNFDYSNVLEITVDQVVNPGSIGNPQSICELDNPGVITEIGGPSGGDGSSYVFQWEESSIGGGAGFAAAPGINNLATYDPPVLTSTRYYRRRVISGACPDAFTNEIEITVNPLPTAAGPTGGGSVCAGNPAPDIIWTLTGRPPFDITYDVIKNGGPTTFTVNVNSYTPPEGTPPYTFTISNPNPPVDFAQAPVFGDTYEYVFTDLDDKVDTSDPSCTATALGGSVTITIGGVPPSFDTPPSVNPVNACDDGGATTDPEMTFSLDAAQASLAGFTLTYQIDGSADRTTTFDTDAAGDPTVPIPFTDAELNTTLPSPHVITVVSILTPSGCLTTFNTDIDFTVVPRPGAPTGPVNNTACSDVINTASISVDDPGAGFTIDWYDANSGGTLLLASSFSYTPGAAEAPAPGATRTYYAEIRETSSVPLLNCTGTSRTAVTLTSDELPANAVADVDGDPLNNVTCNVTYIMDALDPTISAGGATGMWSTLEPGVSYSNQNAYDATITFDVASLPPANGLPRTVTFTWTVSSALGICADTQDNVDIIINPVPEANDAFPGDLCADTPLFQQNTSVDLELYNDDVTGLAGSPDRIVRWYTDISNTTQIIAPAVNSYTITDGQILGIEVEIVSTGCSSTGQFAFTVNPLPVVSSAVGEGCEDALGTLQVSGVNLTLFNNTVTGGAANRDVEWYRGATYNPADLIDPVNGLDDTSYDIIAVDYVTPVTVYARIYDTSFPTLCFSDTELDFTVNPLPAPNAIQIPGGATPASATFCKSNDLIVLQIEPDNPSSDIGPGQTNYTWNVPTGVGEFDLLSSGNDFFILVSFPDPVPGGLPITVFETTDPEGCTGVLNTITIFVEDTPPKPVINDPGIVCENESRTINIQTPTGGSTYTWAVTSGDASIVGLPTGPSILVNFGIFTSTIEVVETNAAGCTAPPADPLVVNMSPRPTLSAGLDVDVCSDSPTGLILNSDVVVADQRYNITNVLIPPGLSPDGGNVANSGYTSPTPDTRDFLQNEIFTNITGGPLTVEYTVEPVNDATGCTGISEIVRATIYPEASLAPNLDATQCSNVASGITLAVAAGSIAADYYIIEGITVPVIAGFTEDPGNNVLTTSTFPISTEFEVLPEEFIINDRFRNVTNSAQLVTYSIRPVSIFLAGALDCIGDPPFDVNFIVNPEPVLADALDNPVVPFERCSDEVLNITLATEPGSIAVPSLDGYDIVAINNGGLTASAGAPAVVNGVGVDEIEDDAWTNTTGAPVTVTYSVRGTSTAVNGACESEIIDIDIIINSAPRGFDDSSPIICSNDFTFDYDLQTNVNNLGSGGNGVASDFDWIAVDNPNVDGESSGAPVNSPSIDDDLINTSGFDQIVTYNVTPTSTVSGCSGPVFQIDVTVRPQPVIQVGQTKTICSGDDVDYEILLTPLNIPAGTVFNWPDPDGAGPATDGVNVPMGIAGTLHITDVLTNVTGAPFTVTYQVTPTSGDGCIGDLVDIDIVVNPEPVVAAGQTKLICSGDNVDYEILLNPLNLPAGTVFNWPDPDGPGPASSGFNVPMGPAGTLHITDILTNSTGAQITVTYQITPTSGDGCIGSTVDVDIVVDPQPLIATGQTKTICSGDNVDYEILLSPLNSPPGTVFNWPDPDGGGPATGGTNVPMGIAGTLHITDALTNLSGSPITVTYQITPTSGGGCVGAPVDVDITVDPEPVITLGQTKTICSGEGVDYEILLTPANLPAGTVFNWPDPDGGGPATGGVNVPMGIAGTLHITDILTNVTGAPTLVTYQITATSGAGCGSTTVDVGITINPEPVGIDTTEPAVCSGAGFLPVNPQTNNIDPVGGNGVTSSFTWTAAYGAVTGGAGAGIIPVGGSLPSETLVNVTGATINVVYTIFPSAQIGGCTGIPAQSFTITIPVDPEPVGINTTQTVCSGPGFTHNPQTNNIDAVGGNGVTSSFTWTAVYGAVTGGTGGGAIPVGGDLTEPLVNTTSLPINVVYTLFPTSQTGSCTGVPPQSFTHTVTVDPEPVGIDTVEPPVCSGAGFTPVNPQTNNINVFGGNGVISSFTWTAVYGGVTGGVGFGAIVAGGTLPSEPLVNTTGATVNVIYTLFPTSQTGGCTGVPPQSFTITIPVDSEPVGINTNETVCSGAGFTINPQTNNIDAVGGNGVTSSFTWTAVYGAVTGGTGSGSIPVGGDLSETLVNTTSAPINVIYTLSPTSQTGSCTGVPPQSFTHTVTVDPEPVGIDTIEPAICSGAGFTPINPQINNIDAVGGNGVTSSFTWTAAYGAVTGGLGAGAIPVGGSLPSEPLVNITGASINVVYTLFPTSQAGGCTGVPAQSFTITIPVNPEPVGINTVETVCSGAGFTVNPQTNNVDPGNGVTSSFTWTAVYGAVTGGVGGGGIPVGGSLSETLLNVTGAPIDVVYTFFPTSQTGSCTGVPPQSFTHTVTVDPEPVGIDTIEPAICSGAGFVPIDPQTNNIDAAGGNGVTSAFTWTAIYGAVSGGSGAGVIPVGGTLPSETLVNVTGGTINVVYTLFPTSQAGGCTGVPAQSFTITIPVDPEPVGINTTETVCSGVGFTHNPQTSNIDAVGGNGVTSSFTWTAIYGAVTGGLGGGAIPVGGDLTEPLVNITSLPINVVYTIFPTSQTGSCTGVPPQSFTHTVTVDPEPVGVDTIEPPICSGAGFTPINPQTNNLNIFGGNSIVSSFTWTAVYGGVTGGAGSGAIAAGGNLPSETLINTTGATVNVVYTLFPTSQTGGCTGVPPQSFTITIPVDSEPVGINTNETACSGVGFTINPQTNNIDAAGGNGVTSSFTWTAIYGAVTGGAGSGSIAVGGDLSEILINNTIAPIDVVYTLFPTSQTGSCTGVPPQSFTHTVQVEPEPAASAVLNDPLMATICSNGLVTVDVSSTVTPTSPGDFGYDYVISGVPVDPTGIPLAGSGLFPSQITGNLGNPTNVPITVTYTITPTYLGCPNGPDEVILVTLNPEPVGSNDTPAAVCSGEEILYDINTINIGGLGNGTNSKFTYTVASNNPGVIAEADRGIAGNPATATALPIQVTYDNLTSTDAILTYTIIPYSVDGDCEGAPFDVVFTVHPEPVGAALTTEPGQCSDVAFDFDPDTYVQVANGGNGVGVPGLNTYTWTKIVDAGLVEINPGTGSGNIAATYRNETFSTLSVRYDITPTETVNGCIGDPFVVIVEIEPEPVGQDGTKAEVCSNEAFILNPQDDIINGIAADFTWSVFPGPGYPVGIEPGPPTSGTDDISVTLRNLTGAQIIVTYEVTPTAELGSTCAGDPYYLQVPVNPEPVAISDNRTGDCSGDLFNYDPQVNITNGLASSFTWTFAEDPGLTVVNPGPGAGNISGAFTNFTTGALNVVYTITPTDDVKGCVGDPFTITVEIAPAPVALDVSNTIPGVCSDLPIGIQFAVAASGVTASQYNITSVNVDVSLIENGGNAAPNGTTHNAVAFDFIDNDIFTNPTSSPKDVIYEIEPIGDIGGCIGASQTIIVTINPEPVVDPNLDDIVCSDDFTNLLLNTNGTSVVAALYDITSVSVAVGLTPALTNLAMDGNTYNDVTNTFLQNESFTNQTAGNLDVVYDVVPKSAAGCIGNLETITITIQPEPVVGPSTANLCSDVASGIILSSSNGVPITTYQLTSIFIPPGLIAGGGNAGLGSTGSANFLANDLYTNIADANLDVIYKVIGVSPDGCAGDEQDIIFTVQPAPAMSDNLNTVVCSGDITDVTFTVKTATPAVQYDIIDINTSAPIGPDFIAGAGNAGLGITADPDEIRNDTWTNTTGNVVDVTYEVSPISGPGCIGPATIITVRIEPEVEFSAANTIPNICSGDQTSITLSSTTIPSAGNITFTVTASDNGAPGEVFGYAPLLSFLPNGHVIQNNLVNLSDGARQVTYSIVANAAGAKNGAGCDSPAPIIEVVTIEPTPKLVPSKVFETVCEGSPTDIQLNSPTVFSAENIEFEITNVTPNGGLSGFSPIGTTFTNGQTLADVLVNPTTVPQLITYELTPQSDGALGCSGDPVSITVTVNPTATATITGDATICSGGFATLQFAFSGAIPFSVTYNDGTSDITDSNLGFVHFVTVQPTATTTYTLVSVSDANGCDATGLGDQVTIQVEDAVADPTIEGDNSGCSPLEVTFRNNAVSPGVTYEWNWGDGTPSTITSDATVTHEFNNASTFTSLTYNVTLFATNDAQGCLDTESVTVEVEPTILPAILPSTLEGCAPLTVSFLNNTLGAAEHEWFYREKGTNQELEVGTTPLITYELPNETPNTIVYEVVYTASKGACSEEVITDVTVFPELSPSFTISENPIEVNEDDGTATITVTNTTLNKNAWTYEWNWGDGETTTAVDPGAHTYQQYGEYEISVRILFDGGICEASASEVLIVEPIFPDVNFEADILEGCQPLTVNFTNLSVATDPNSFSWEIINVQSGNVEAVSNQENFTYTFNNDGTYTVTLSGSNPLGIVDTETKDNYIKVNENPVASFSVRPSIVYLPDGVVFTQNLSSRADKFFWDFNANDPNEAGQANGEEDLVSELFEPEVVYNYRGFKDIMLVAEFTETGCKDTLIVEQAVFVDQGGETRVPNAFSPNPDGPTGGTGGSGGDGGFNDNFLPFVQGVAPEPGSFHMQIFDRWGNLVFESWDQNVGWDGYDKNGKLMPMGVYVYRLDLKFVDGNTSIRIGDVTLVR